MHVHPEHPGGDQVHVECLHPGTQHGFDEIKKWGKTFKVPCVHVPPHPGGHDVTVPCTHLVREHPDGDTVPCVHVVPTHSDGDEVRGPCIHPLGVWRFEPELNLIFHTGEEFVQRAVIDAVHTLRDKFGIRGVGNPLRPLHITARDWDDPSKAGPEDPCWSHYERDHHTIQISPLHRGDRDVILHELGHALAGTQLTRIRKWIHDPHDLKMPYDAGMAMGEGWAHFVALALLNPQDASVPTYHGMSDWESRDPGVERSVYIEYNVACLLWDLYDKRGDMESTSFSFKELFSVLSPSLETLDTGFIISGVDDYLDRLQKKFPGRSAAINRVRELHLSSGKTLASGLFGGQGGDEFWDDVADTQGIARIKVRSGALIDAIQVDYRVSGGVRAGARHGGGGGSESSRDVVADERLTLITGQTDGSIVKQLNFHFSRRMPSGAETAAVWRVGPPGALWITLHDPSGSTARIPIVPGTTASVAGTAVAVPGSTRVGSLLNVPGQATYVVEGEHEFRINCTNMTGFYGRSGMLLDAIGVMYK